MKKLFSFLSIALISVISISCDREEPILDDNGQDVIVEDPFKDYPRLESVGLNDVDTRVSYDGLQTSDSRLVFQSKFDAGDIIYIVVYKDGIIGQYQYEYVENGKPWVAVDENKKAPLIEDADYYAYWNGKNEDLKSYLTVSGAQDVATFFKPAMRYWVENVLEIRNQGTLEKFRTQDLLTGKGVRGGQYTVTFTLYHAMGLICIEKVTEGSIQTTKYLSTDEYYRWTESTSIENVVLTSDVVGEITGGGMRPYDKGDGWLYLWVAPREVASEGTTVNLSTTVFSVDGRWSRTFIVGTTKFQRIKLVKNYAPEPYILTLGDIFYDDGSLSHSGDISTLNGSRNPVGLVVSLNKNSIETDGTALTDLVSAQENYTSSDYSLENRGKKDRQGQGFHALVLALKDAANSSSNIQWATNRYMNTDLAIDNISTFNGLKNDFTGYKNTKIVWNQTSYSSRYPAFGYVKTFGNNGSAGYLQPSKTTTTGWFMPSSGQWMALSEGLLDCTNDEVYYVYDGSPTDLHNNTPGDYEFLHHPVTDLNVSMNTGSFIIYALPTDYIMDRYLANAGGDDMTRESGGIVYWSSSEATRNGSYSPNAITYCIGGEIKELAFGWNHKKDGTNGVGTNGVHRVRAMLAF